jgi:hypothetical protein
MQDMSQLDEQLLASKEGLGKLITSLPYSDRSGQNQFFIQWRKIAYTSSAMLEGHEIEHISCKFRFEGGTLLSALIRRKVDNGMSFTNVTQT